jgi:hypothetical protein
MNKIILAARQLGKTLTRILQIENIKKNMEPYQTCKCGDKSGLGITKDGIFICYKCYNSNGLENCLSKGSYVPPRNTLPPPPPPKYDKEIYCHLCKQGFFIDDFIGDGYFYCNNCKENISGVINSISHTLDTKTTKYEDETEKFEILNDKTKQTNPKDAVGVKKVPFSTVPAPVIAEVGLALLEGARKYGRHNYRSCGVRASVYYDAIFRHITSWFEGEDIDEDSGLSHVTKAIACLVVLRDSMLLENWVDDRPPKVKQGWVKEMNKKAAEIIEKYPNAVSPFLEKDKKV